MGVNAKASSIFNKVLGGEYKLSKELEFIIESILFP
jgi:hypothetical protein